MQTTTTRWSSRSPGCSTCGCSTRSRCCSRATTRSTPCARLVRLRARRWADTLRNGDDTAAHDARRPADRHALPGRPRLRPARRVVGHPARPGGRRTAPGTRGPSRSPTRPPAPCSASPARACTIWCGAAACRATRTAACRRRRPRPAAGPRDQARSNRGDTVINDRLIDAGRAAARGPRLRRRPPPLLLLHGAGGNLAQMTTLARALRPHHRVITIDLRGHGRSGDGAWTWDAALGDLAAVCVQMELDRPAVVGHSLGGMLAALWGQRHPETPGVVSLDGNPPPTRVEHLPGLDPREGGGRAGPAARDLRPDGGRGGRGRSRPTSCPTWSSGSRWRPATWAPTRRCGSRASAATWCTRTARPRSARPPRPRPSCATLMNELDLGPVYAATTCPELVVLPTRDLPEQEPFAELYAAHRRFLVEQAAAVRPPALPLAGRRLARHGGRAAGRPGRPDHRLPGGESLSPPGNPAAGRGNSPSRPVILGGGGVDPVVHDDQIGAVARRISSMVTRLSRSSPCQRQYCTIRRGRSSST